MHIYLCEDENIDVDPKKLSFIELNDAGDEKRVMIYSYKPGIDYSSLIVFAEEINLGLHNDMALNMTKEEFESKFYNCQMFPLSYLKDLVYVYDIDDSDDKSNYKFASLFNRLGLNEMVGYDSQKHDRSSLAGIKDQINDMQPIDLSKNDLIRIYDYSDEKVEPLDTIVYVYKYNVESMSGIKAIELKSVDDKTRRVLLFNDKCDDLNALFEQMNLIEEGNLDDKAIKLLDDELEGEFSRENIEFMTKEDIKKLMYEQEELQYVYPCCTTIDDLKRNRENLRFATCIYDGKKIITIYDPSVDSLEEVEKKIESLDKEFIFSRMSIHNLRWMYGYTEDKLDSIENCDKNSDFGEEQRDLVYVFKYQFKEDCPQNVKVIKLNVTGEDNQRILLVNLNGSNDLKALNRQIGFIEDGMIDHEAEKMSKSDFECYLQDKGIALDFKEKEIITDDYSTDNRKDIKFLFMPRFNKRRFQEKRGSLSFVRFNHEGNMVIGIYDSQDTDFDSLEKVKRFIDEKKEEPDGLRFVRDEKFNLKTLRDYYGYEDNNVVEI